MDQKTEATVRAAFEKHMTDDGMFPRAVERNPRGGYILMSAASAWGHWQACAGPLMAEIERLEGEVADAFSRAGAG